MNKVIVLIVSLIAWASVQAAETNVIETTNSVASKSEVGSVEFTLGGSGSFNRKGNDHEVGLDVSLAINPLKFCPTIWAGVNQSFYWDEDAGIAGSTDLNLNHSQHLFWDLYLNIGWSVGTFYEEGTDLTFRSGPELTAQYYLTDNSFIYSSINYDYHLNHRGDNEDGVRYSVGLGLSW